MIKAIIFMIALIIPGFYYTIRVFLVQRNLHQKYQQ